MFTSIQHSIQSPLRLAVPWRLGGSLRLCDGLTAFNRRSAEALKLLHAKELRTAK